MREKAFRVLLVDDDVIVLSRLRAVMISAGFEVVTARDGWTGLECIRLRQPDAVVCDRMMPGRDVHDLRQILAHDPSTSAIPFLLFKRQVRGRGDDVDEKRGPSQRAARPRISSDIVASLRSILGREVSEFSTAETVAGL
jgi:CheY-like chemotaxis protein